MIYQPLPAWNAHLTRDRETLLRKEPSPQEKLEKIANKTERPLTSTPTATRESLPHLPTAS